MRQDCEGVCSMCPFGEAVEIEDEEGYFIEYVCIYPRYAEEE